MDEKTVTVEIPGLEPEGDGPLLSDRPGSAPGDSSALGPAGYTSPSRRKSTRRTIGMVVGGAGVATAAAALGFGWSARNSWERAFESGGCDRATSKCDPGGQSLADDARSRADIATLVASAGGALVVTGIVLYMTARPRENTRRALRVAPVAGPTSVGLCITGGF